MADYRYVGTSQLRLEGPAKLSGKGGYVADLQQAGTVYARPVLSPYPHAKIKRIDASQALAVPGVLAVYTAEDLGRVDFLARNEVLYVGHPVALVVAEDEAIAEDGAELVEVDWEPLPAVLDPLKAMEPDSPLTLPLEQLSAGADAGAHGEGGGGALAGETKPRNVNSMVHYRRGNIDEGFAQADAVVEGRYHIARVYQGFLETQGSMSAQGAEGLTIWTSTQGQFMVRRHSARQLGLDEQQVRIVAATVGGGFGGKIEMLEPVVGMLARKVGRPVAMMLDRLQDFLMTHTAPAAVIDIKLGGRRDGTLVALKARLVFDAGAGTGAPLGIASLLLGGTYRVPNLDVVAYEVLTHKTPVGAYRAPGAPQAYFALESAVNQLARQLKVDPLDLRIKNAAKEGDDRPDGGQWPKIGLVECLERLKAHPLWQNRDKSFGEGLGVAVGGWGGGLEPAAAACQVQGDGTVTIQVGSVDLTGAHTTFAIIAAEVLGMPVDKVRVVASDTAQAPYAGMSGGSKTIYTVGAAVKKAAEQVRDQILELAAERLEASVEDLEIEEGRVGVRGVPSRGVKVADLARLTNGFGAPYAPFYGHGRSAIQQQSPAFTAHLAKVRVDTTTGLVKVVDYVAAQDVGRALNPAEVIGQIQGGVAQGLGRALLEQMVYDADGQLTGTSFMDYLMPTVHDIPPVQVELVEVGSLYGPFGAKGVGEPPAVPGGAAIANAVEDALGVQVTTLPISPDEILLGIESVSV